MIRSFQALPLALAVAWVAPALAGSEDALDPTAKAVYLEAKDREAGGALSEAAVRYRAVFTMDPAFTQATVDLGRVLEATGDLAGAEAAYADAPYDADAVEARGRLYLASGRNDEAAGMFRRLRELRAESPAVAVRLLAVATAGSDPDGALGLFKQSLEYPGATWDEDTRRTALALLGALRDRGASEALIRTLEEVPGAESDPALRERFDRARVEDQARKLRATPAIPLTASQDAELRVVRAAFSQGRIDEALSGIRDLLAETSLCAEVWGVAADVFEAAGEIQRAEDALLRAKELDPLEARYPARLGDLLSAWYGGRFDHEAADAYREAAVLDPGNLDVAAKLARAERSALPLHLPVSRKDWPGADKVFVPMDLDEDGELTADEWSASIGRSEADACASWTALAARAAGSGIAAEAERMRDGCQRERAAKPVIPTPDRPVSEAGEHLWIARVYRIRGRKREAREELDKALALDPNDTDALLLDASLAQDPAAPDPARARASLEKALARDPGRADAMVALGQIEREAGHTTEAHALWTRAADAGSADALFWLALEAQEARQPFLARQRLVDFEARATSGPIRDRALALRDEVDRTIWTWQAVGAGGAAAALGLIGLVPAVWWMRRRSGVPLSRLLDSDPTIYRDVARILSSIRHEVLKHNTPLLPLVADALDRGDTGPAEWASERLYGAEGAIARFRERVRALEQIGRSHGLDLDLRSRDPVLGPVVAAMDRLSRLEGDLRRGRASPDELRGLSHVLNQDGYRRLGTLIRSLSLVRIDAAMLRAQYDRVRGEPAFQGVSTPEADVDVPEPVLVRLYRAELDDVVANLLRNALQATVEQGAGRVGVRLAVEEDEITGLERVVLRFRDDAPRRITTGVLRSRYIERGLGLTVDIISRNGGSIAVEGEPGWSKAVVVRLPRAEREEG